MHEAIKVPNGASRDIGVAHPVRFKNCLPMKMIQGWKGVGHGPEEGGHAYIGWEDRGVVVYSYFEGAMAWSTSTADGQRLWELGDVVEVFLHHTRGTENGWEKPYWEVHVNPNGHKMELHIPNRDSWLKGDTPWEVAAQPSGMEYTTRVLETSWATEILLPWSIFGGPPAPNTVWGLSVCRYNYRPDDTKLQDPELSSTSSYKELSYHRLEDFTPVVFRGCKL
eukprot:TRINITY_DN22203_c0_g1_i1.p1 TRINITY_DN22203_c0_g1~~TRINITY_DN22203_c0_g1_i1.p1  ORF type:complete len:246 (+),score=41.23 TRINITY_DN22203_c0_g1_i1:72-740(+)